MASKTWKEWWFGSKKKAMSQLPFSGAGQKWIPYGNHIVNNPVEPLGFITDGYQTNDIVYSIINLIVDKATVAPWAVYKIVDDSSLKSYKALQKEITSSKSNVPGLRKQALEFRAKALVQTNDNRLNQLLDYPNENQSWTELLREELIYKLITGNKFVKADLLEAGGNTGKPGSIYCLPTQSMTIVSNGMFPAMPQEYRMQMGQYLIFTKEEVLHEKFPSVDYSLLNNLYGQSPLQAASMLISRTNESTKSGATAFKNMGAGGLLYMDDMERARDMTPDQVQLMKDTFYNDAYNVNNKKAVRVTNNKMGYLPINLSPVDLAILDSEKWDVVRLCAVYGVPPVLIMPDNATYNNIEHAEKALTTRAVLPHLIAKRDALNRKLQTDWGYKGQNIMVDFDMDVYHELRQDVGEQVKYLNEAWWFTLRMKYEAMEMEMPPNLTDEELDMVFAPRGTIPLSDVGLDAAVAAADTAIAKSGLNGF